MLYTPDGLIYLVFLGFGTGGLPHLLCLELASATSTAYFILLAQIAVENNVFRTFTNACNRNVMVVLNELDLLSTIEGASYIDLTIILVKHEVPRCGLDKEQVNVSDVFLEQHTIFYLEWTEIVAGPKRERAPPDSQQL